MARYTKRYQKRRAPYVNRQSTTSLALKAFKGVKAIKKLINVEKLIWDDGTTVALSTTPAVFNLQQIAQGDTYEGRTGNSIKPQYLKLNMQISPNTTAAYNFFRVAVVRDTQQIADTLPAWTDVFSGTDTNAFRNPLSKNRFNILYDKVFTSSSATVRPIQIMEHLKLTGHIFFNGGGSNDIQKNGLYVMYLGNQGVNTSAVNLDTRLVYTDN